MPWTASAWNDAEYGAPRMTHNDKCGCIHCLIRRGLAVSETVYFTDEEVGE